jgi:hypothetical protein
MKIGENRSLQKPFPHPWGRLDFFLCERRFSGRLLLHIKALKVVGDTPQ